MEDIKEYYNKLASDYDRDRFGNSYGNYLDRQEKAIVRTVLNNKDITNVLDVGCGTGRFLEFASHGIDLSEEMIRVAKKKFPEKKLFVQSAVKTEFENSSFDSILSFHMFMHLDKKVTAEVFNEMNRILKKGGRMIFDVPSEQRRKLVNYKSKNWHGANDFTPTKLKALLGDKWEICEYYGIAFFPVHSIPKPLRSSFRVIDTFLCHTFLKNYSSYLLFVIRKK
jgi:ubiquinone/menaquinone biosynthesis C-methylase UbiE